MTQTQPNSPLSRKEKEQRCQELRLQHKRGELTKEELEAALRNLGGQAVIRG